MKTNAKTYDEAHRGNENEAADAGEADEADDYSKLLALIDEIKQTESFGESHADRREDGSISLYWTRAKVVDDLYEAMESHWDHDYLANLDRYGIGACGSIYSYDVSQADVDCILTFLTAVVRKDRFNEGALVRAFGGGHVLRWLERLAELVYLDRQNPPPRRCAPPEGFATSVRRRGALSADRRPGNRLISPPYYRDVEVVGDRRPEMPVDLTPPDRAAERGMPPRGRRGSRAHSRGWWKEAPCRGCRTSKRRSARTAWRPWRPSRKPRECRLP